MSSFRRWHLLLIPVPVFGWLLLLAYGLDEMLGAGPVRESSPSADSDGTRAGRLQAAMLDYSLVVVAWALLPPAFGWLLGAVHLLFRDATHSPSGFGRRLVRARAGRGPGLSFTSSFSRNLPLLVPYLGPVVETLLVLSGRPRLGDRLAGLARPRA